MQRVGWLAGILSREISKSIHLIQWIVSIVTRNCYVTIAVAAHAQSKRIQKYYKSHT